MRTYVEWKSYYTVGNIMLDSQHKEILGMINTLYNAMDAKTEHREIKALLDRLVNYTQRHFQDEERLMHECGYAGFSHHKSLHDHLRRRTVDLRDNLGLVTDRDMLHFLKQWWTEHIQQEDKCYADCMNSLAVAR